MGIGSKLKKLVRKIIPNEAAEIAVKAAPFVAPFNPAIAAAMAGIGSFDQTGRIGSSLKSGAGTYIGGQGARYLGGAGLQGNPFTAGGTFRGGNPFTASGFQNLKGSFSSPLGSETGIGKFLSGKSGAAAELGEFSFPKDAINKNPLTGTYSKGGQPQVFQAARIGGGASESGGIGSLLKDNLSDFLSGQSTIFGGKKEGEAGGGGMNINDLLMRGLIGGGSYLSEKKDLDEAKKLAAASGENKTLDELAQTYALAPVYAEGGRADDRNGNVPRPMGFTEETLNEPTRQMTAQEGIMGPTSNFDPFMAQDSGTISTYADGGRTGYSNGSDLEDILTEQNLSEGMSLNVARLLARDEVDKMKERDSSYADGGRVNAFLGGLFGGNKDAVTDQSGVSNDPEYAGWKNMFSQNPEIAAMHPRHMEFKQYHDSQGKADGGMMYNKGGLADLGGHELDMRPGGFIPIGAEEKADDIPARLSKNEFVFTADAVREYGDGNVNKGAKKMYSMMNKLEQGSRV